MEVHQDHHWEYHNYYTGKFQCFYEVTVHCNPPEIIVPCNQTYDYGNNHLDPKIFIHTIPNSDKSVSLSHTNLCGW